MADLTLPNLPETLMVELREWAALRRCSVETAAIEMIRIGLYQTRDRHQELADGFDVTDGARH